MTGQVVEFGKGMKPLSVADAEARIIQAMDGFPQHDPFRVLLDALLSSIRSFDASARTVADAAGRPPLTQEQLNDLARSASWGGQEGVRQHVRSLDRWAAVRVAGIAVLAAAASAFITNYVDQGRVIDTQSALGAMRADDAAQWARIIRVNPPPQTWETQPIVASDGSNAVWALLRLQPPLKTQPKEKPR